MLNFMFYSFRKPLILLPPLLDITYHKQIFCNLPNYYLSISSAVSYALLIQKSLLVLIKPHVIFYC